MKYFDRKTIRQALENNLNEKLKYIPSKIKSMVCKEIDGVSIVDSALPSDTFNTVFGGKINEKICREICSYYQKKKLPFAWWVLSNALEAEKYLIKEGLDQEEEEIGMTYDLTQIPQKHKLSKQLTIR